MFMKTTKKFIEESFCEVAPFLEKNKADVIRRLRGCAEETQIAMKFLYASMPISDIVDYDFETYLSFADHALYLKENACWCTDIPDDIFLNYVLYYRINNEDVEENRKFFYDLIYKRVAGKTMEDAALEVNYWCMENVVYKSTDIRTASPLTMYRCGSGRCGEESTFTVTALRSVGIPARQIYTPRWSHCDDNHAWVEVWCNGKWHYIGACEPEPIFDKGWFTEPASRAVLIHNRIFSSIIEDEDIIGKQGKTVIINRLKNYAVSKRFTVNVVDDHDKPITGAIVRLEVLNESEFYPVASIISDEFGKVEITMGLADIHIHVIKGDRYTDCFANVAECNSVVVQFKQADKFNSVSEDFKIMVPEGDIKHRVLLTENQKEQKKQRVNNATKIREERMSSFYKSKEADKAIEKYLCKKDLKIILHKSQGNFEEIKKYLMTSLSDDNEYFRIKLLESLSDKDYFDLKSEILIDHLQMSLPFCDKYEEDIFIKYVLCPRIYSEKMTSYRKFISDYFEKETKLKFVNNPHLVWEFVLNEISSIDGEEYEELITTPQSSLQIRYAGMTSKKVLFTAICRTIGVPARINPMTLSPEYYQSGKFISAEKKGECTSEIVLHTFDNIKWIYLQNWSLGILENGAYCTLNLSMGKWENGNLIVKVPEGFYRLLVSNRMPNGNLFAREYFFKTEKGQICEQCIAMPDTQIKDLLENIPIADFKLINDHGCVYLPKEIVKELPAIMIWLEEGREPTEHILNEFIEHHKELNNIGCQIIFILRSKEALLNPTLQKTLKTDLNIQYYFGDFTEDAPAVARSLYSECEKFPLVLVTCDGMHAIYSFSGYNVGAADLLVKIIKAIN